MGRKKNKPKGYLPKGGKRTPKARPPEQPFRDQRPLFCFQHIDTSTKEPWAFRFRDSEGVEALDFLGRMAQLSWREIEEQTATGRKSRPRHHSQPTSSIARKARNDLTRRRLDDTFGDAPMFRFRLSGEKRLWGFRVRRIFHAVWWDPEHKVCPTEKN